MKERRGRHPQDHLDVVDPIADELARQNANRLHGTVVRRVPARYFGFIRVDGQRDEYFYHADDLENCDFSGLLDGDLVTFVIKASKKGPRAGEVRRV